MTVIFRLRSARQGMGYPFREFVTERLSLFRFLPIKSTIYSTFRRKLQPSVRRAFPPVGWHKTELQFPQTTTDCAWLKTVVLQRKKGDKDVRLQRHPWDRRYLEAFKHIHHIDTREGKHTHRHGDNTHTHTHMETPCVRNKQVHPKWSMWEKSCLKTRKAATALTCNKNLYTQRDTQTLSDGHNTNHVALGKQSGMNVDACCTTFCRTWRGQRFPSQQCSTPQGEIKTRKHEIHMKETWMTFMGMQTLYW